MALCWSGMMDVEGWKIVGRKKVVNRFCIFTSNVSFKNTRMVVPTFFLIDKYAEYS